jgi:ABC-2 type transport system ATP-binding protein
MAEPVLEIRGLCKEYPAFRLKDVGFSLERGRIMGFIGRNGAGKTTTLKSMLNIVHPSKGEVRFFGLDFAENELEIKKRIAFVSGGANYYPNKKLAAITAVTRSFYERWDEAAYRRYLSLFALDESKTPKSLSAGMQVKYALALALSHGAELLILDEPTSGLDPVSREELLDDFCFLRDKGVAILFSTHITSDLEKCADHISYISKGRLIASEPMRGFLDRCAAEGTGKTLDEIMVHYEKESLYDKLAE